MPEFSPVEVRDERGNVIYLRPRVGFGIRNQAVGDAGGNGQINNGRYLTALLRYSIVSWSGPDLDGRPVDYEALDELDPALGDMALVELQKRNPGLFPDTPNQGNGSTNGSAPSSTASSPQETEAVGNNTSH